MVTNESLVGSTDTDSFVSDSAQYDRYVELADLGRLPRTNEAPEYWAPAPAPLTISAQ
jgi:hypothetical protein